MTKIVICGAGFAGLNAALKLERKFKNQKDVSITLVDRRDYHLFNPSLYEVATADEELVSVAQLRRSIALPLRPLLAGKRVNFIQAQVGAIDRSQKKIKAGTRAIEYDYLVLALGSKTEYFNVEGAEQFALPLKNLRDAFFLRNAVEFAVQARRQDSLKQQVRFVVAGGGYSGVELAAELAKLADVLAWKNNYPREKIEISLIEAANGLVPGFDKRASGDIARRLGDLKVQIKLLAPIFRVDKNFVWLLSGEKIAYDALAWTTGVRAQDCLAGDGCVCNRRGQFETDEFLRVKGQNQIFALGDIACIHNSDGSLAPATAQAAVAEANYLAEILPQFMQNRKPPGFCLGKHPFIVTVGGKWAIYKSDKFYFTGWLPYLLRLGANVLYFAGLIGWFRAARYVLFDAELYSRND